MKRLSTLFVLIFGLIGIVGCSNDYTPKHNSLNSTQSRKIAKITNTYYEDNEYVGDCITTFTYDNLDRIVMISYKEDSRNQCDLYITYVDEHKIEIQTIYNEWDNGGIVYGELNDRNYLSTIYTQYGFAATNYEYNYNGYLCYTSISIIDTSIYYNWNGGNLTSVLESNEDGEYNYTMKYNNKVLPNINIDLSKYVLSDPEMDIEVVFLSDFESYAFNCIELSGAFNKNSVIEVYTPWGDNVSYNWSYDIMGYPKSCIGKYVDDDSWYVKYEFEYL